MADPFSGTIRQSELNRLLEQLNELRQALRPFALYAAALPSVRIDAVRFTDAGPMMTCKSAFDPTGPEVVITFADMRRAKEVLDVLEQGDTKRFLINIEEKLATPIEPGKPDFPSDPDF